MKLYSEGKSYKLYQGNMLDMLSEIKPNSIDSIVTDPPYELNFMGKGWDSAGVSFQAETWKRCYEVLKSGGYLLAFGGSRTYHRIACAIEDAGFEIRDTIMWLYGSGFPKGLNIANGIEGKIKIGSANKKDQKQLDGEKGKIQLGYNKSNAEDGWRPNNYNGRETTLKVHYTTEEAKKWQGWHTSLKPSFEPIIVARKPFSGTLIDNILQYGVGAINIDECRVEPTGEDIGRNNHKNPYGNERTWSVSKTPPQNATGRYEGRYPANTILTYDETDFDEVCGGFPNTKSKGSNANYEISNSGYIYNFANKNIKSGVHFEDSGSASRYFYCAKASKRDRDEGLNNRNIHPTVKPTDLMQYLVRLVTPKGGTVLDPFNGSGSTGKAVMYENKDRNANYKYIGIELTEDYLPIAKARIEYASGGVDNVQLSITDCLSEGETQVDYTTTQADGMITETR